MSEEVTPSIVHQESYGGPTAAAYRMQQFGGVPRPDRSSSNRHVYYIPSRQQWGSIELHDGTYLLAIWTACPCSLG